MTTALRILKANIRGLGSLHRPRSLMASQQFKACLVKSVMIVMIFFLICKMKYANILEHFSNSVNQKHNITESCLNKTCLEYENAGKR